MYLQCTGPGTLEMDPGEKPTQFTTGNTLNEPNRCPRGELAQDTLDELDQCTHGGPGLVHLECPSGVPIW